MTLKEVYDAVLTPIDELQNAGEYAERLVDALNTISHEIVTLAQPLEKYTTLSTSGKILTFPEDFLKLVSIRDSGGNMVKYQKVGVRSYRIVDNTAISYQVCYKALPSMITIDTDEDTVLDLPDVAREALIYGITMMIGFDDDDIYGTYSEKYHNSLANLSEFKDTPTTVAFTGFSI